MNIEYKKVLRNKLFAALEGVNPKLVGSLEIQTKQLPTEPQLPEDVEGILMPEEKLWVLLEVLVNEGSAMKTDDYQSVNIIKTTEGIFLY